MQDLFHAITKIFVTGIITICVEMNVYTLLSNAMALALKTQPFVEIDALMRGAGIESFTNSQEINF